MAMMDKIERTPKDGYDLPDNVNLNNISEYWHTKPIPHFSKFVGWQLNVFWVPRRVDSTLYVIPWTIPYGSDIGDTVFQTDWYKELIAPAAAPPVVQEDYRTEIEVSSAGWLSLYQFRAGADYLAMALAVSGGVIAYNLKGNDLTSHLGFSFLERLDVEPSPFPGYGYYYDGYTNQSWRGNITCSLCQCEMPLPDPSNMRGQIIR